MRINPNFLKFPIPKQKINSIFIPSLRDQIPNLKLHKTKSEATFNVISDLEFGIFKIGIFLFYYFLLKSPT
ncbi:hypothetical protein B0A67_15425 [Flavobacterium aquidurense]|nr:hypothetical protein B0A67_15425 [Flavobacterium aquidurense]